MPRKSVVWLTDRSDMTLDVYRGRKTTMQQPDIVHVCAYVSVERESVCVAVICDFTSFPTLVIIIGY